MAESSRFWNGSTVGDATEAAYDAPTEFANVLNSLCGAGGIATNQGGVFRSELNELLVTAPGSVSPCSVDSGRAIDYGNWYQNTAAVSVAIPTPGAATRIDRIVLRKGWVAQTVRITRIAGVEGGAAPALVQIAGTTWDIPLAQASITTGGVITLTDERQYCGLPYLIPTCIAKMSVGSLAIGAVDTVVDLGGEDFDNAGMHDNAVNPARITIPADGIYEIGFYVVSGNEAVALAWRMARIRLNGASTYILRDRSPSLNGGILCTYAELQAVGQRQFSKNDYIDLACINSAGGDSIYNGTPTNKLWARWVGPSR